ncbi:hypothetical protein MFUL124B02_10435 [Myxococcus fulvus 124B02]|nr:hypothetical protein MFUL124B02_10435 [Myxococcus fulvus 124B02]
MRDALDLAPLARDALAVFFQVRDFAEVAAKGAS